MNSFQASSLGLEFDAFLFATIDEAAPEARLSVVSALARLDIDPWLEAAELTRLPEEAAVQRLGCLLTSLPGGPLAHADRRTIASHLIALLPDSAGPATGTVWTGAGAPAPFNLGMVMMLAMFMSVVAASILHLAGATLPASAHAAVVAASTAALPKAASEKMQPQGVGTQF